DLNRTWRGRNTATDVLAFPFGFQEAEVLGDIIIDIETALHQKCVRSLDCELQILFIHGLLHLLGYDHIAFRDAELMHLKEKEYSRYIKE
ncbi:MAG: rRNA maturation RNase YbeY, partial [Pedobacter sp.]